MFPTKDEKEKALCMENNYKLFKGKYSDVLRYFRSSKDFRDKREVITNVCEIISNTFADLLFLEEPIIRLNDPKKQAIIDEIIENNTFFEALWQGAIGQSWGGKAVFEVRLEDGKAKIDQIPPDIVFQQLNQRYIYAKPDSVIIAWHVEIDKKYYLFKKIHTLGFIRCELWECETKNGDPKVLVPLSIFDPTLPEEVATNWDKIPIFIANNPRDGKESEGSSDYRNLYSLLEEFTRVNSQIATQLEKHADAKLAVPPGVITDKGVSYVQDQEVFEVDASDGGIIKPEYITNSNPLIEYAFQQKKEILQDIARVAEVAFILMDLEQQGGVKKDETFAESAAKTIAKVKRKRKPFKRLIREVLSFAYKIQTNKDLLPSEISVKFRDGLPENELRKVQIESLRIGAGIQTKRDAIKNIDNIEGEALDAKVQELEKDSMSFLNPAI